MELAHWKSPQESGVVFAFGLVIIYMLSWSSRSVLSLTCLALALPLCISVITSLIYGTKSSKWAPRPQRSMQRDGSNTDCANTSSDMVRERSLQTADGQRCAP